MTNKLVLAGVGAAILLGIAGLFLPHSQIVNRTEQIIAAGSPAGSVFNSAKVAAINMAPSTGSATSSSIFNGDSSDRIVTDGFAACSGIGTSQTAYTGAGLANLVLKAATTSASGAANVGNNGPLTVIIATSTASDFNVASSTYVSTAGFIQRWAAGSYMTFSFNATNTAACTVGVHYLAT